MAKHYLQLTCAAAVLASTMSHVLATGRGGGEWMMAQALTTTKDAEIRTKLDIGLEMLFNDARSGNAAAREMIAKLAKEGIVPAQFRHGQLEALAGDTEAAQQWWTEASSRGYGRASFALGNLADSSAATAGGIEDAVRYYALALKQGYAPSLVKLRLARAMLRRGREQDCSAIVENLRAANDLAEAVSVVNGLEFKERCEKRVAVPEKWSVVTAGLIAKILRETGGNTDSVLARRELASPEPISPRDAVAARKFNELGLQAVKAGDYASAAKFFLEASAQNEGNPELMNNLGFALLMQGKTAEAEAALVRTLRLNKRRELAWINLAMLYSDSDRDTAQQCFRIGLDVSSNRAGYLSQLSALSKMSTLSAAVREATGSAADTLRGR